MKDFQTEEMDIFIPGMELEEKEVKELAPMPDSFEDATKEEISETLAAFRKRAKEEEAQKKANVSTDFWFAVYFASEEQRNKFLAAYHLMEKMDGQYIAGDDFCNAVGFDLPEQQITIPKAFRKPAGVEDLIMEI